MAEEQTGEFAVVEDSWFMVQFGDSLEHTSSVRSTLADGGELPDVFYPTVGRPFFAWSDDLAVGNEARTWSVDFTCSATALVIRNSAGAPITSSTPPTPDPARRMAVGDEARAVLTVYAHVLGEGQRRDFVTRLAAAEQHAKKSGHPTDAFPPSAAKQRSATNPKPPEIGL